MVLASLIAVPTFYGTYFYLLDRLPGGLLGWLLMVVIVPILFVSGIITAGALLGAMSLSLLLTIKTIEIVSQYVTRKLPH